MELIETKNGRLFRSATKAGKLGKQPIGVNSMAAIPRFIATFLELPNVDEFSGHFPSDVGYAAQRKGNGFA